MADNQKAIIPQEEGWRPRIFLVGGLIGALLGVLSAWLYVQAAEEKGATPEAPSTNDTVKLGISLLGIIRTITEWGSR